MPVIVWRSRAVSVEGRNSMNWSFHKLMLALATPLAVALGIGSQATGVPVTYYMTGLRLVLLLVFLLPAILWHDLRQPVKYQAAQVLPWAVAIETLLCVICMLSATAKFQLQDSALGKADAALWVSVPSVVQWVTQHPGIHMLSEKAYLSLWWFLPAAVLIPPIAGQKQYAERFMLAHMLCLFAVAPVAIFLPAIGPWVGHSVQVTSSQVVCESTILTARAGTVTLLPPICLPSLHAIWAILAAAGLWGFRRTRSLVVTLAVLITISTVTTGWHYVVDVVVGVIFAFASLAAADRLLALKANACVPILNDGVAKLNTRGA